MRPDQNCWRIAGAGQFSLIVDAADYFVAVREAMLKARHSILLIGWDFDARITLGDNKDGGPARLGDFLIWLADRTPGLQIRLLRWDTGAIKSVFRGNTLWTILRWKAHPRITLRLDGAHPFAGSHHQKIVVIDDCMAFCGGIDMTMQRWDTREHLDDDPRRVSPSGRPHPPWHDATTAFDGKAARALGDLARERWQRATGETLPVCDDCHDCWPDSLTPNFKDPALAILRTLPKMKDVEPVHEIEEAWVDMIAGARRFIYAESQYFASRKIARAMAQRLIEDDPPEIVIINPHTANGWLEPVAMDTARARLVQALQRIDHRDRLRIYHPQTARGTGIYVHAKVTIMDDRVLRVGSSNFNNRSMRLDSECDVVLATDTPGNGPAERGDLEQGDLEQGIAALRNDLMAEHLGVTADRVAAEFAQTGSLIRTVENLRSDGRSLVPYQIPELSDFKEWLADNEILDPNGPEEIMEITSDASLFRGWHRVRSRLRPHLRRRLHLD